MAMDLRNSSGDTFRVSGGHWAVYLTLAQAFGWKPSGTKPPKTHPASAPWHGQYATNDGQSVTDEEAKLLAQILHSAALNPVLPTALADVIAQIEGQMAKAGTPVPPALRMNPSDFYKEIPQLIAFLYKGSFYIE